MDQYVLDVAGLSDQGVKRDHNEDAWSAPPADLTSKQIETQGLLYVVADGIGGHRAGDVASAMAVETIQERYYATLAPDVATNLIAAIQEANEQIYHAAAVMPERHGMGTTVTAVVLRGSELTVVNVGDSRTYLIREGQARQVTTDHSWVEAQVQVGIITRAEANKHPQRNIITRSLGNKLKLQVDIFEEQVMAGDSVLLCSDGLSNLVSDPEIGEVVSRGQKAEQAVRELIALAKQRGAPDNVTTVLLNVKRARSRLKRTLITAGITGGLLLLIGALAVGLLTGDQEDGGSPLSPLTPDSPLSLQRHGFESLASGAYGWSAPAVEYESHD